MLAGLLGWPQATFCSEIQLAAGATSSEVLREIDGGSERINVGLPAVFTADLRLNEPRYATIPNIMKARKKKIEEIKIEDTGVDITPRLKIVQLNDPPTRQAGVLVGSVDELVEKLKNEAKVL